MAASKGPPRTRVVAVVLPFGCTAAARRPTRATPAARYGAGAVARRDVATSSRSVAVSRRASTVTRNATATVRAS